MTWPQFLLAHCNIGKSRSYELIAIADGRKSLEEIREGERDRKRDFDQRNRDCRNGMSGSNGQSSQKSQRKQQQSVEERERAAIVARITARLRNLTTDQLLTLERIVPNGQALRAEREACARIRSNPARSGLSIRSGLHHRP